VTWEKTVAVAARRYWIVSVLPFQRGIIEHFTRRLISGLLEMNHLLSVCLLLIQFVVSAISPNKKVTASMKTTISIITSQIPKPIGTPRVSGLKYRNNPSATASVPVIRVSAERNSSTTKNSPAYDKCFRAVLDNWQRIRSPAGL
jgi:hypothetical protein